LRAPLSTFAALRLASPRSTVQRVAFARHRNTSKLAMSLCKECISGVTHEGTPTGKIEKIGGVDVYVALPTGDYPKEKALLFLTDVFGVQLVNNQLLADDFAKNGFQVYMPEYFKGDPIPVDAMNSPSFDREKWSAAHGPASVRPIIDTAYNALTEKGITIFGAMGYCFGARYVMDLALENKIHAGVFTHPSRLAVPDDFHALLAKSQAPVLFNTCEVDRAFPAEAQAAADEILGGGEYAPGYERTYWEGCTHGFAVRGDMTDPKVKAGKEGAFKATAEFFMKL